MLDTMRRYARSWVVKVLLGLLILSFAVWGIGDVFLGTGGDAVAEVDGLEIDRLAFERELDARVQQLQEQTGQGISREQAVALGLAGDVMGRLVAQRLVDRHGQDLGLGVAEAEIARTIRENPLFSAGGGFDRERYLFYLRQRGLSEEEYVAAVREDLRRGRLVEALTAPTSVPTRLAELVERYRDEEREVSLLRVDAGGMEVPAPSEEDLRAYLEENQAAFREPERRDAALLVLDEPALEAVVVVTEDELRQAYEARREGLSTPERRDVAQVRASSREALDAVRLAVEEGSNLEQAAAQVDGASYDELSGLEPGGLPGDLGEAVFSLQNELDFSQPVQSPFGWHLFRLLNVEEGATPEFAAVREDLERNLRADRAYELLPEYAEILNDEVAGGATLEEAAAALAIEPLVVTGVDRFGLRSDGEPVAGLLTEMIEAIFDAPVGEVSFLEEAGDGYFVFRVDNVSEARDLTLDEARGEVSRALLAERRQEAAVALAEELAARAAEGGELQALAAGNPAVSFERVGPFARDGRGAGNLARPAIEAAFATPEGQVTAVPVAVPEGAVVLLVEDVVVPEASAVAGVRQELLPSLRQDVLIQYEQALRERYPVTYNDAVLRQVLGDAAAGGGES